MAAPYNNPGSKLDRAVAAYLVSAGAGTSDEVYTSADSRERQRPSVTVSSLRGQEEFPFSVNWVIELQVKITAPAAMQSGDTNFEKYRKLFDARVATTYDALHQNADGEDGYEQTARNITNAALLLASNNPTDHADLADFSCLFFQDMGFERGEPNDQSAAFIEILKFKVTVATVFIQ